MLTHQILTHAQISEGKRENSRWGKQKETIRMSVDAEDVEEDLIADLKQAFIKYKIIRTIVLLFQNVAFF